MLAVIAFHLALYAEPSGSALANLRLMIRFGWTGVDLFFVLSGFLITGILYDHRTARERFRAFYGRRLVRIFPLYYATLALYALTSPLFASPEEVRDLVGALPWHVGYLTNVRIAVENAWAAAPIYTSHLWSLAVEEQFYLLWPALLALCGWAARRFGLAGGDVRRAMMGVCASLVVASLVVRVFVLPPTSLASYVLLPGVTPVQWTVEGLRVQRRHDTAARAPSGRRTPARSADGAGCTTPR